MSPCCGWIPCFGEERFNVLLLFWGVGEIGKRCIGKGLEEIACLEWLCIRCRIQCCVQFVSEGLNHVLSDKHIIDAPIPRVNSKIKLEQLI